MQVKRHLRNLPAITLAAVLVVCIAAAWMTRDSSPVTPTMKSDNTIIDAHLLATAHRLAAMADTSAEQSIAHDALRLADHELDQAFASAIRDAASHTAPKTAEQRGLAARVSSLKATIAAEKARAATLKDEEQDLAKAQLELDQDQLEDAQADLARLGGDPHAKLAQALQEHEAAQHDTELPKLTPAGPTGTFAEQLRAWFALAERDRQIQAARQDANARAERLVKEHEGTEQRMHGTSAQVPADSKAMMAHLHQMSDETKAMMEFDKRIQDCQQLVRDYSNWSAVVEARRRGVLHLMLRSLALIFAILLAVVVLDRAIRHAFRRQKDARRLHQLRVMATVGVQVTGVILIVLIVFGPPTQITTAIGLVTAGLTVALKDFIVGFVGWFALMGKNGIRIGDWVEINGVGGEVIEIGLLKTVLLEMGNWTSTGHPTGRRVAFVNSFALEGHYFNFSTSGQWLWDELQVLVPQGDDPYLVAEQIRKMVEGLTEADAAAAELDWERVTHQYGTQAFSARPAVDVRPAVNGLNVVVRYITRGPQRYEVKSRIFEQIVALLHRPQLADKEAGL